jgi:hypothetical protein
MNTISEELTHVEATGPSTFKNLSLFPLYRPDLTASEPDYLLLEEAIAQGLARITEAGGGGSVPEIKFENDAEIPVLLLDGEELLGAKQDRVLNLTILAPPKRTTLIPVSCVEPGRWRMTSPEFRVAGDMMCSRVRAARCAQVSASMRTSGTHGSDQARMWDELAAKASRLGVDSPTGAMAAMYERHALLIDEYVRAFAGAEGQTGVLCAMGRHPLALDLFDHSITMRRLFPKLVRSYALDALDAGQCSKVPTDPRLVSEMLKDASRAPAFTQPAIGLGKDVRFLGRTVSGSALWANGRYVHICAFAASGAADGAGFQTRMSRPTHRRASCVRTTGRPASSPQTSGSGDEVVSPQVR